MSEWKAIMAVVFLAAFIGGSLTLIAFDYLAEWRMRQLRRRDLLSRKVAQY